MATEGRRVNCPSSLSNRLSQEFNNRDFSDIKLVVGGQEFFAHRMLLANQSEMFRIMFKGSQWVESTQEEVTLTEPKECTVVFHDFLQFFYAARIHLTVENIVPVRILADKYQHVQLLKECDRYVIQIIRHDEIDTIVGWLVNMANLGDKMEKQCLRKLQLDFTKLMNSESSRSHLSLDLLIKIVDSSNVVVCNELMLFNLIATWIMERRHASSQKSAIGKLMPLIRFPHMTIEQLAHVENCPLGLKYSDMIIKYMLEAYKSRAQLAYVNIKTKEKEKNKDKDTDAEPEKLAEAKRNLPMPRLYTEAPWGSGYVKPIDAFLSGEYDVCNFTCPVVDRALKPYCVSDSITKKTTTWDFFYKREIKTYTQSEDQIMTKVLVTHDFACKYKITENPRAYEIIILTGYTPIDDCDGTDTTFTTITTKQHHGTVKTIGHKTFTRRKFKFTEILKPVLLAGSKYVFSVSVHYKE